MVMVATKRTPSPHLNSPSPPSKVIFNPARALLQGHALEPQPPSPVYLELDRHDLFPSPCPPGWGADRAVAVTLARLGWACGDP